MVDRRPTQSDVARMAGVSRGVVSVALSGSPGVSERTRQRIRDVAEQIGYVRNLGAAALAGHFPTALGMVLPDLRNPFFEGLVAQVQTHASRHDLLPLIVTTLDDPARESMVMHRLHEQRVAGIIAVSPVQTAGDLVQIARSLPLTIIGTEPLGGSIDVAHMDEDAAARLVSAHVRERGWARVLHLSGSPGPGEIWVERRRRALAEAFSGMPFSHVGVPNGAPISPILARLDPDDAERPLAIITHNDLLAMDVVPAVHSLGLIPGRDVAVVSFDDTHMAARPEWSLTSVRQDVDELATTAVEALLTRQGSPAADGRETVIAPTLTVRSTS